MIHLREYPPRMHWMLSISGQTHYHVIQKACPNMNHHMSSKQRKSASNSDNTRKMQSGRNCSIHNLTPAFRLFSSLGKHTHKCGPDLTRPCMVLSPQLLQGLATIMGSLVDLQVGLVDMPQMETVGDTIIQIVVKVVVEEVIVVGRIRHKDGPLRMAQVVCLALVPGVVGVMVMELGLQITLKVVHMVVQVLDVALT